MPKFLTQLGWAVAFDNAGTSAFSLKPGEIKTVVLRLKPGREFTAQDVVKARNDAAIVVTATADGIVVGGMTYVLDSEADGTERRPSGSRGALDARSPREAYLADAAPRRGRAERKGRAPPAMSTINLARYC